MESEIERVLREAKEGSSSATYRCVGSSASDRINADFPFSKVLLRPRSLNQRITAPTTLLRPPLPHTRLPHTTNLLLPPILLLPARLPSTRPTSTLPATAPAASILRHRRLRTLSSRIKRRAILSSTSSPRHSILRISSISSNRPRIRSSISHLRIRLRSSSLRSGLVGTTAPRMAAAFSLALTNTSVSKFRRARTIPTDEMSGAMANRTGEGRSRLQRGLTSRLRSGLPSQSLRFPRAHRFPRVLMRRPSRTQRLHRRRHNLRRHRPHLPPPLLPTPLLLQFNPSSSLRLRLPSTQPLSTPPPPTPGPPSSASSAPPIRTSLRSDGCRTWRKLSVFVCRLR